MVAAAQTDDFINKVAPGQLNHITANGRTSAKQHCDRHVASAAISNLIAFLSTAALNGAV